jgi:glycogen debranching enzyme
VGGGLSVTTPISDGVMGALVTDNQDHALQALGQLTDPDRFGAPWGPANVARNHPAYDPAMYWRGPAWPILNYLFWLAMRRWECDDAAAQLAGQSIRSAVGSGWAEYWNPDTGQGLGAAPQTWTTVVTAMT